MTALEMADWVAFALELLKEGNALEAQEELSMLLEDHKEDEA